MVEGQQLVAFRFDFGQMLLPQLAQLPQAVLRLHHQPRPQQVRLDGGCDDFRADAQHRGQHVETLARRTEQTDILLLEVIQTSGEINPS